MNDEARAMIEGCAALLLDFDGPMTKLLPAPKNAELAEAACGPLLAAGSELPDDIATTTDHLKVLRWAGEHAPDQLDAVEAVIIAGEVEAAQVSEPTDGLVELLRRHGHKTIVVTNNAPEAAQAFLDRLGEDGVPVRVCGRPAGHPELMKPSPHMLQLAAKLADADPSGCLMIGDHASDADAATAIKCPFLGFATTPNHASRLRALAHGVVTSFLDCCSRGQAVKTP